MLNEKRLSPPRKLTLSSVRLQTKIIAAFSFVIILAVIIFFVFAQSLVFEGFEAEATQSTQQLCVKIAENADTYFDKMDEISKKLISSPTLLAVLDRANNSLLPPTGYESLNYNRQLGEVVSNAIALTSFPYLNVYVYSNDGRFRYVYGQDKSSFPAILADAEWTQALAERKMFIYARPAETDNPRDNTISFVRAVYDVRANKYGYVEIQSDTDRLAEICNLDGAAEVTILDERGRVIYSTGPADAAGLSALTLDAAGGDSGMLRTGTGEVLFYTISDYSGAGVYVRYSQESIYSALILMKNATAILMAAVSLLCLLLVFIFARRLTRPIRDLRDSVMDVSFDNMGLTMRNADNDEVTLLGSAFQHILGELRVAADREIALGRAEADARLAALQAQISPHFIHNVLYTISISAREQRNEDVVSMCKQLSDMLRYTVSNSKTAVTMAEELACVASYLELEAKNYEDSLFYTLEMEDQTRAVPVPRLSVQPFVENAIKHAFDQSRPPYRIDISVTAQGQRWRLAIRDNGAGIGPQEMERLTRKLETNSLPALEEEPSPAGGMGGMGIVNSVLRLRMMYGDGFRFGISSPPEGGTLVTLEGALAAGGREGEVG